MSFVWFPSERQSSSTWSSKAGYKSQSLLFYKLVGTVCWLIAHARGTVPLLDGTWYFRHLIGKSGWHGMAWHGKASMARKGDVIDIQIASRFRKKFLHSEVIDHHKSRYPSRSS